jgi:hypothetical protein
VDASTGLTKHQLAISRTVKTLKTPDENGVTGYQKLGAKTRATHMQNVDEHGRNGYSQVATRAIVKGNQTKADRGQILDPSLRDEFYRYKSIVMFLTAKHNKQVSAGYFTGLAGTPGAFQLDHRFSISDGFKLRVSPFVVGARENLEMIPWRENLVKHAQSNVTLQEILELTGYTDAQSTAEYEFFQSLILEDIKQNAQVTAAGKVKQFYESALYKKREV